MKSTIMLLTLSFYSTAIVAEQADDQVIYPEYDSAYLNDPWNARSLPAPVYHEEPRYLKLIVPADDQRYIRTIKADLNIAEILVKVS